MNNKGAFTIALGEPFLQRLAEGVLRRFGAEPMALARVEILLPNRRSCRALADILVQQSGQKNLLLPRISAIGDSQDEDEEVVNPASRLLLFLPLVERWFAQKGATLSTGHSIAWAQALMQLYDEAIRQRVDLQALRNKIPPELAGHAEEALLLLQLIAEAELPSPEALRNKVLEQKAIQVGSARHPIILAGSLGTVPATAELMRAVLGCPQGMVVLPGLDREAGPAAPGHPQYLLQKLLQQLSLEPQQVQGWVSERNDARTLFCRSWMAQPFDAALPASAALPLQLIEADSQMEEAQTIALLLRETLTKPEHTAILVTPDRALARYVSHLMQRWNIALDDSAGVPLLTTPQGHFAQLVLELAEKGFTPLSLLAVLKHPECRLDRQAARQLELDYLRRRKKPEGEIVETLQQALAPLLTQLRNKEAPFVQLAEAHWQAVSALMQSEPRAESDTMAKVFTYFRQASAPSPVRGDAYPALFRALFSAARHRPRYGTHPRLTILSPQEARLCSADRIIISSLNDSGWGAAPTPFWTGRTLRQTVGLPGEAEEQSHALHDLIMLMSAPEMVLTRARYEGGEPQNAHPVLLRLKALQAPLHPPHLLYYRQMLDAEASPLLPEPACPPLANRPERLSASDIQSLITQPYRHYAQRILKVVAPEPLPEELTERELGNALHKAVEWWINGASPHAGAEQLLQLMQKALHPYLSTEGEKRYWKPRLAAIAQHFLAWSRQQAEHFPQLWTETKGSAAFSIGEQAITLSAIADCIALSADGTTARIIDYKTGNPPTQPEVSRGQFPQLPVEQWIAAQGGFGPLHPPPASFTLQYWHLHPQPDETKDIYAPDTLEENLRQLLSLYYQHGIPYFAFQPESSRFVDAYLQLSRAEEALRA